MYSPFQEENTRDGKLNNDDPMTLSVLFQLREKRREISGTQLSRLKIMCFLNFITLALIIPSIFLANWFIIYTGNKNTYWSNYTLIRKIDSNDNPVYQFIMYEFIKDNCIHGDSTQDDPPELCDVVENYTYSGLIALGITTIGLIIHLVHIVKLILLLKRPGQLLLAIQPFRIPYLISALYIGSIVWWALVSGAINNDHAPGKGIFDRMGCSLYLYLGGSLGYLIIALLYRSIK